MKTVQLALRDTAYSRALESLLTRDGAHRVYRVEKPDLRLDGVVVTDGSRFENAADVEREPERFVVLTHRGGDQLARIWDAGVRHVVFEGDSPSTAQLAVIAAELRMPASAKGGGASGFAHKQNGVSSSVLPVLD